MTGRARRVSLLTATMLLACGSSMTSIAESADPLPTGEILTQVPALLAGDFYVDGGPMHNLIAYRHENAVRLTISVYDALPFRRLYRAELPASSLFVSDDLRTGRLVATIDPVGLIDIQLRFLGLSHTVQYGCFGALTGFYLVSREPNITASTHMNYSGSIGGKSIRNSNCPIFAGFIDAGVWYSSGVRG